MTDANDMELLQDYDRHGSEAAFAALVARHIHLVYSVALRHTGMAAHAEEITQAVFVILARKAASLRPDTILEGWLHETTRLTALSFLRGERRRRFREQEAYMQSTLPPANDAALWNQLAPMLDEAVSRLGKKDRDAVMLRFFKDKNLREVAAALDMTEAAAQRRVHRAVEKLRGFFTKRGVTLTAAVLTAAISANSVQAAPVGLAATVTAAAVKGTLISATITTLVKGTMNTMAWLKLKFAAGVGVAVLLVGGAATVAVSNNSTNAGSDEAAVVAFKEYLSHPPRIARLVFSKSLTDPALPQSLRGIRRYIAAVDGDSFFYREIKAGENPDLPISARNKMRSSLFVGRSGDMRWQIVGFDIKEAVNTQPDNPDVYTALADSERMILNGIFSFSSQNVEPGSFSWNGNKFEARLSKLYKSRVRVEPPLPDTFSGSIKTKHGNVVGMDSDGFGIMTYDYDSSAHLPLGIPSKITRDSQSYTIHELVFLGKEDVRQKYSAPKRMSPQNWHPSQLSPTVSALLNPKRTSLRRKSFTKI